MNEEQKLTRARQRFGQLQAQIQDLPWILNGSVMKIAPRSKSPAAKTTYTWTRKVKGKTVTVALSYPQYLAFREAIAANRKLEHTLTQMRKLSQNTLLNTLPGVKRKPRSATP
jgi:hypothetical protein